MESLRTVLVLDDNRVFLEDFESLMEGAFKVVTTQSEADAFDILSRMKIDAMLLDLMLSEGQSGLDVLKRVK
jgi:CheY-like chemotaxis protein